MAAADQEERAPLLVNAQENPIEFSSSRKQVKSLYETNRLLSRTSPYDGDEARTINISASNSIQNLTQAEPDHIVSIFVVAFDTKAGKIRQLLKYRVIFLVLYLL